MYKASHQNLVLITVEMRHDSSDNISLGRLLVLMKIGLEQGGCSSDELVRCV
jgi:hypothetical protein